MAGFIILEDGRAYAAANWAFRSTVEAIAESLPETTEGKLLADWLRQHPTVQVYHRVDVRELTPTCREKFFAAVETAFERHKAGRPADWVHPEDWEPWLERFGDLVKMIGYVR